ncbi:hypothetical protein F4680DRAFT_449675 [Xylaria scruposa]|nr:hypothetical protein F4680DRAFT_449675 [Xylaria scruposa]
MLPGILRRHCLVLCVMITLIVVVTLGTNSNLPIYPSNSPKAVPKPHLNYYEILNTTIDATNSELKRAYRRQVAKWHSDKVQRLSADKQIEAKENYDLATEVYETLTSYERCDYDLHVMKVTSAQYSRCKAQERLDRKNERDRAEEAEAEAKETRTEWSNEKTGSTNRTGNTNKTGSTKKTDEERGKELALYAVGALMHFIFFERHKNIFIELVALFYHWALMRFFLYISLDT